MNKQTPKRIDTGTSLRNNLPLRANPRANRDYVISLRSEFSMAPQNSGQTRALSIHIRYVPDRLICDATQMPAYFDHILAGAFGGIEEMANAIADDFCNELIPRWISAHLSQTIDGITHSAMVEDRQPLWDNPALLQRRI